MSLKLDFTALPEFDDHEMVIFAHDQASGLRAFISIHNTNCGPATGGTRYYAYPSEIEGLRDALRLSRAMTYKCAMAGVPFGGGKGVIVAGTSPKTPKLFRTYGRFVDRLNGFFSTGEDVGVSGKNVAAMGHTSRHINGLHGAGELGPWAARGVFMAMQAALESEFGTPILRGRIVAIQGLGKVGLELAKLVARGGGEVIGTDIDLRASASACKALPSLRIVRPKEIYGIRADVFSPCALGRILNKQTIPRLRAAIVCGGANDQLHSTEDGRRLHKSGILYVPDYIANAGGLINVVAELRPGGYDRKWVTRKVREIGRTASLILRESARRKKPTKQVADEWAEKIFRTANYAKLH